MTAPSAPRLCVRLDPAMLLEGLLLGAVEDVNVRVRRAARFALQDLGVDRPEQQRE